MPPTQEKNKGNNISVPSLNTGTLTAQPSFQIEPPKPSTGTADMLGYISGATDNYQANLDRQAKISERNADNSFDTLLSSIENQITQGQVEGKAYGVKGGVDDIQKELDTINDQIRQEQRGLENALRDLEDQGGGLVSGQNIEKQRLQGESLRRQADLYVIQQGAQGKYDSARAIADRAVDAVIERQRNTLQALELNYNRNKSLFDKDEQRAFDSAQSDRNRALDFKEEQMKQMSDLSISALENGAPTSVVTAMRNAKDVTEALSIGGGYIGLLQRQAASRSAASANLSRRKDLLELALMGDPEAITELGYDPNNLPMTAEETIKNENAFIQAGTDIARVNGLLTNAVGLNTSTGQFRNAFISGALGRGEGPNIKNAFGIPIVGNIAGAVTAAGDKQKFLNDIGYIATNLTFEKLANMEVKLTPISNEELKLVGQSANELAGAIRRDESGNIEYIALPADEVTRLLIQIESSYKKVQDELNYKAGLNSSERNEIINL